MDLKEFAALKEGDRIENSFANSRGLVVGVDNKGVHIRWLETGRIDRGEKTAASGAGVVRHYSVQSTIWMHWSKVQDAQTA